MMEESDDFELNRKETKSIRKIKGRIERSSRKKSDNKPSVAPLHALDGEKGRIVAMGSTQIEVMVGEEKIPCSLAGFLKKERWNTKNLVAIGDWVGVRLLNKTGQIISVFPRTSFLERIDPRNVQKRHMIAANIDLLLITTSLWHPRLKPHLIDRFIVAAYQGNLTPVVVINKMDLLEKGEKDPLLETLRKTYKKLKIELFEVSSETGLGLDKLSDRLAGTTSLFAGQSGVGKTSLINELTDSDFRIATFTAKNEKGIHTTTQAMLVPFKAGGFFVDTPGIRNFSLPPITLEALQKAFPDIQKWACDCKIRGCSHSHEPDCAVKKALEKGTICPLRYDSYHELLSEKKPPYYA